MKPRDGGCWLALSLAGVVLAAGATAPLSTPRCAAEIIGGGKAQVQPSVN
jgi:hypothetical protein